MILPVIPRIVAALALLGAAGAAQAQNYAFRDTSLSFERRTADLLSQLTFEEKCQQVHVHVNQNTRLNLPEMDWWTEANHGLSARGPAGPVTVFPQAIGMAATFDPPIVKQIGDATATEAHARFEVGVRYRGLVFWAPTLNMARDPRWGRVEETYGEDPFLGGRMAVAMCQGMQGDDPRYLKGIAVPKHMAVHSGDATRFTGSNNCPEPLIRDYYLPAFHDAFVEGHALGTMTAFSEINGVPATANPWLLTQVLQKEWGFSGMVTSDNGAVQRLYSSQRYVNSSDEAVAAALNAGLTILATFENTDFTTSIRNAIDRGLLTQETLDKAVARNLLLRFRLGEFDPPEMNPYSRIKPSDLGSKANVAIALKTAQEAMVLLKNDPAPKGYGFDRLLPLDLRRVSSVALIGSRIQQRPQFGAYSGNPANPSPSFAEALRTALGERVTVRMASGGDDAVEAARDSDVVIFLGGLTMDMEHEGIDRSNMALPYDQVALLERILPVNPNIVAVMEGGSCMDLGWVQDHAPAALMIWYSGEQGATAMAQIITGQVNPSGHLPLTFYQSASDLPTFEDYDISHGKTYWYVKKPVTYPFGHGLSYTTFDYRKLQAPAQARPTDTIKIKLEVANTGKVDGDEVVQLYVREKNPPAGIAGSPRPIKQLKAFQRVSVAAGKSVPVELTLPVASLAFWDPNGGKFAVDAGIYELQAGTSSADIRCVADLTVK